MKDSIQKAQILIEAFPFIRQWHGSTVVVKYGGSTRGDAAELKNTLQDIVLMKFVGMRPVVVHGGGKDITRLTEKLGIRSQFVDGLRVTVATVTFAVGSSEPVPVPFFPPVVFAIAIAFRLLPGKQTAENLYI